MTAGGARSAALLPAAGAGSRLGLGPKALLRLGGRTLLEIAVAALRPEVDEIVAALPPALLERDAVAALPALAGVRLVAGGASRQATVLALLEATEAEVVLVHDAARPFLPRAVTARVLAAARERGAATAAVAVADSLLDAVSHRSVDRDALRAVQTPQGFRRDLVLRAHRAALADGVSATDDAALVRRLGEAVALVEGSPLLFKVTRPDDLHLARAVAASWPADGAVAP